MTAHVAVAVAAVTVAVTIAVTVTVYASVRQFIGHDGVWDAGSQVGGEIPGF